MKLCKDCRFADNLMPEVTHTRMYWECDHPSALVIFEPDLVTGDPLPPMRLTCTRARSKSSRFGTREHCGPEAQFWQPIGFGPP